MKLYVNKLDNLEEMDKYRETYHLPKLSQVEIDNMNRPITRSEIESVTFKKTPCKQNKQTNKKTTQEARLDFFWKCETRNNNEIRQWWELNLDVIGKSWKGRSHQCWSEDIGSQYISEKRFIPEVKPWDYK